MSCNRSRTRTEGTRSCPARRNSAFARRGGQSGRCEDQVAPRCHDKLLIPHECPGLRRGQARPTRASQMSGRDNVDPHARLVALDPAIVVGRDRKRVTGAETYGSPVGHRDDHSSRDEVSDMRGRAQREPLRRADMGGPTPARLEDPASDGPRWEMRGVGATALEPHGLVGRCQRGDQGALRHVAHVISIARPG